MDRQNFRRERVVWTTLSLLFVLSQSAIGKMTLPDQIVIKVGGVEVTGWRGNKDTLKEQAKQDAEGQQEEKSGDFFPEEGFVFDDVGADVEHFEVSAWSSHGRSSLILKAAENKLEQMLLAAHPGEDEPAGLLYAGVDSAHYGKNVKAHPAVHPHLKKPAPEAAPVEEPRQIADNRIENPVVNTANLDPSEGGAEAVPNDGHPHLLQLGVTENGGTVWYVILIALGVAVGFAFMIFDGA